jgi:hypothetical protein
MGRTFFSALEQPRALWVIFAALVGLRLIAILAWVEPSSDAAWYFSRAAMLADGRGYLGDHGAPTAYWPPGWPLALSVLFRLTGPAIWAGLVNLVLSCLAGWLCSIWRGMCCAPKFPHGSPCCSGRSIPMRCSMCRWR